MIQAKNGKFFPAKEVFATSISYLKDKALEILKERTATEFTAKDIQWVITVPAIWKPPAKQFMREAAKQVSLNLVVSTNTEMSCPNLWLGSSVQIHSNGEITEVLMKSEYEVHLHLLH